MPELQNGAGGEKEARGDPEDPGVKTPQGLKTIDHLVDNGYGIYDSRSGKPLMFVPRDELLAAPNPGAYFQAILDQIAQEIAQDKGPVEVPENLSVRADAGHSSYVISQQQTGEVLRIVPWDSLPSDPAEAAQLMQWIVNHTAAQLKHHKEREEKKGFASEFLSTFVDAFRMFLDLRAAQKK